MGKRFSKPQRPPPPPALDPILVPEGCMGMTRDEYDKPRMEMAPFLYYKLIATSNRNLVDQVVNTIRALPIDPSNARPPKAEMAQQASSEPGFGPGRIGGPLYNNNPSQGNTAPPVQELEDPNRRVHGPIYLFVAYDAEKGNAEAFLFFPSMTKAGEKWPNYYSLGIMHRWMFRIMNGPDYRIQRPRSSCTIRMFDRSIEMGCRTDSSYRCMQSKRMHKKMGLYRRKKNRDAYPAIYYRMYRIRLDHPRIRDVIHPSSLQGLQRNILPSDIDMFPGCRYMLVSPNQRFFYVLSRSMLTLFRNMGSEDIVSLCMRNRSPKNVVPVQRLHFRGYINTRAVLEEGKLRVFSQYAEDEGEETVLDMQAATPSAELPLALVLEDSGRLVVYDRSNTVVSSNLFDQPLSSAQGEDPDEYDPVRDRKERMMQLVAYMKLIRLYRDIADLATVIEQTGGPSDLVIEIDKGIPPFEAATDYIRRLERLLEFLFSSGRLRPDDPNRYGFTLSFKHENQIEVTPAQQAGLRDKQRLRPYPVPGLPNTDSVIPNNIPTFDLEGRSDSTAPPPMLDPDQPDPDDPCDNIVDDEEREKCVDRQESAQEAQATEEDSALHDFEASLASGEVTGADLQGLLGSQDAMGSAPRSVLPSGGIAPSADTRKTYSCPAPRGMSYDPKHDMHCRLLALQDAIRRMQRPLVVLADRIQGDAEQKGAMFVKEDAPKDEFDLNKDRMFRLETARSAFKS